MYWSDDEVFEMHNCDCIQFMKQCVNENRKFDYIITSPPYNMNVRVCKGGKVVPRDYPTAHTEFSRKYDEFNDDMQPEDYYTFISEFVSLALQVTDMMFFNIQIISGNRRPILKILGDYSDKVKDIIVWDKITAQPAMKRNVLNSQYEFIFIFSNDEPYFRTFKNANFDRGSEKNLFRIKREQNKYNKASFPEQLVFRLLHDFTKEGDTIFDPFAGSGTTGICCIKTKRNFVGCELCDGMFKIANERLNETDRKYSNRFFGGTM